jgi:hypothetical protein
MFGETIVCEDNFVIHFNNLLFVGVILLFVRMDLNEFKRHCPLFQG